MSHCGVEQAARNLAELDFIDAQNELDIADSVFETALIDLELCEEGHA